MARPKSKRNEFDDEPTSRTAVKELDTEASDDEFEEEEEEDDDEDSRYADAATLRAWGYSDESPRDAQRGGRSHRWEPTEDDE